MMESILIESATGGSNGTKYYEYLRREFMRSENTRHLLPDFVRTHRTLGAFWPYIRDAAGSYADRRMIITNAFTPLIDYLEGRDLAPMDSVASDSLRSFDSEGVHEVWEKALSRRKTDPEGAITIARTLLETVLKRILDETGTEHSDTADLPKLYRMAAEELNLSPTQHSAEAIKMILGGATTVVNGLGTLRNRLSDSHGRSEKIPVRPAERHAKLAVNMAGTMASFLVETHLDRQKS